MMEFVHVNRDGQSVFCVRGAPYQVYTLNLAEEGACDVEYCAGRMYASLVVPNTQQPRAGIEYFPAFIDGALRLFMLGAEYVPLAYVPFIWRPPSRLVSEYEEAMGRALAVFSIGDLSTACAERNDAVSIDEPESAEESEEELYDIFIEEPMEALLDAIDDDSE